MSYAVDWFYLSNSDMLALLTQLAQYCDLCYYLTIQTDGENNITENLVV